MTFSTGGGCAFCRRPLPRQRGPGRPREFCCPACRTLSFLIDKIEAWLGEFLAGLSDSEEDQRAIQTVKRRLWAAGNLCNAAGAQVSRGPVVRLRLRVPVDLVKEADRRRGSRQEELLEAIKVGFQS